MPSADEILFNRTGVYPEKLSGPEEENAAARALQREKANNTVPEPKISGPEPSTFNQARLMARNKESKVIENPQENSEQPTKAATITAGLLSLFWKLSASGFGFIAWFFYANIHWFGNAVLGKKYFCAIGEEKTLSRFGGNAGALKYGTKAFGWGEKGLLVLLDAIALFTGLLFLGIFVMFFDFFSSSPLEKISKILSLGWSGVTELIKILSGFL